MSRWLILSVLTTGLLVAAIHADDVPALKTKAKAEPRAKAPLAALQTRPKTEPKEEPLDEKTVKELASYAIGMNFGKNLVQGIKQDGADVDTALVIKGFKDALSKAEPPYTDQQLNAAIEAFDTALEAKTFASRKTVAEKNKKDGEAFLAHNEKEKGIQTTPSGLQYKVLKSGDGKTPQKTDTVRVHYHGTLPDGSSFDSSKQRGEPVEFAVTGVIKGWTEALLMMKVGDKWMLYVPSNLAYGAQRRSEAIGPNQVLVFEVELLDIVGGKQAVSP
jgi:FKBP-type peptidyl-prolyl cis-trans isomerase FklB